MAISLSKIPRLVRTVRYLKPRQIVNRLCFRLARPKPDLSPAPSLRLADGFWAAPATRPQSLVDAQAFDLLNERGDLDVIGWQAPEKTYLWRYTLHYFDDLTAERASQRKDWHEALIADWIGSNPPATGVGWEPYPTSLRIVNWIKWAMAGNAVKEQTRQSLAIQTRWLGKRLETHLLGNHLFANAKALVFAGLFFRGNEADGWLQTGLEIIRRELGEQILADSGHFERSTMYHALAIEDLLDLTNVARAFGREDLCATFAAPVPPMLEWLAAMSHPDGRIGFFNDAAFGIAPENAELLEYAERLEVSQLEQEERSYHLASSGYLRASLGAAVLLVDAAQVGPDYLPGHAHADTLSFELSLFGQRIFVNSGTSEYGTGPERLRQRSTAAHCALTVDGENSSEVWSGFRVGRRARPAAVAMRETNGHIVIEASHDGYRHLSGRPLHRRTWILAESALTVEDSVQGSGEHRLESYLHLHPDVVPARIDDRNVELSFRDGEKKLRLHIGEGEWRIAPSHWHPEFGKRISSHFICISREAELPVSQRIELRWGDT